MLTDATDGELTTIVILFDVTVDAVIHPVRLVVISTCTTSPLFNVAVV
jgi:hypothetical protein